jgi:hypothetical protein
MAPTTRVATASHNSVVAPDEVVAVLGTSRENASR